MAVECCSAVKRHSSDASLREGLAQSDARGDAFRATDFHVPIALVRNDLRSIISQFMKWTKNV
jgi:hypothetical protein